MAGLLSKIFGKSDKKSELKIDDLVEDVIIGLLEKGNFLLSYEIKIDDTKGTIDIELFGEDEDQLKERDGQMLDAVQLFLTRVIQHQMPDTRVSITVDCDGFREEANQLLIKLADKLKNIALKKQKSVYFRALPPKDRKVIHQYLAEDARVKSHSVGDGLYKKIKIYPSKDDAAKASKPAQ